MGLLPKCSAQNKATYILNWECVFIGRTFDLAKGYTDAFRGNLQGCDTQKVPPTLLTNQMTKLRVESC